VVVRALAVVFLAVLVAAPAANAADEEIVASPSATTFTPAEVTILVGDTVTVSKAAGSLNHNSHYTDQPSGCPASPTTGAWSYPRTFASTGDFTFHCDLHTGMRATVHVGPSTVSIANASKAEGDAGASNASLTVSLAYAYPEPVTVDYATANGSAVEPGDYAASSGTLTFAPGEKTKTLTVAVNGDSLEEPDESFSVDLSNPTNATIGSGHGVVTITDDDGPNDPTVPPPDVLDTTAPQTTIDSGPQKKTEHKKATFAFSSSETGSSFECALDRGAFAACKSPRTVRVSKGKHRFDVRATDAAGNPDPSAASYSWKFKPQPRHRRPSALRIVTESE
jgi:plastocyanin